MLFQFILNKHLSFLLCRYLRNTKRIVCVAPSLVKRRKKWSIKPSVCFICKRSGNLRVPGDQGKRTFIEALIKRGDCNGVKVEELKDQVINFEMTRLPLKYDGIKTATQLS